LPCVVDELVVEYQHGVRVHALMEPSDFGGCEGLADVDAGNLGRKAGTNLAKAEGHDWRSLGGFVEP